MFCKFSVFAGMKRTTITGICIFILLSCSKESPDIEIDKLTKGKWYLTKMNLLIENPVAPSYNIDSVLYPVECESDDYLMFMSDSSFVQHNNGKKCNASDVDSLVGTWSYDKTKTSLLLSYNLTDQQLYQVCELNLLNMVLLQSSAVEVIHNGKTVTIKSRKTYYYKNK
jgi:hypothetical protein